MGRTITTTLIVFWYCVVITVGLLFVSLGIWAVVTAVSARQEADKFGEEAKQWEKEHKEWEKDRARFPGLPRLPNLPAMMADERASLARICWKGAALAFVLGGFVSLQGFKYLRESLHTRQHQF